MRTSADQCPLCRGESRGLFAVHGFWIRDCAGCGHRFAAVPESREHVPAVYGDDYFQSGGAGYQDYLGEAGLLRAHGQRYGKLLTRFTKPGTVLDVGAAAGFILQGLMDHGWRGRGIEPNERMAAHGRTLGLDLRAGAFEELPVREQYDLVNMVQVMAHFVNPGAAVEKAAALTKPGGLLLVETWNRGSFTARLLGSRWHEYSPPSVLHFFTPGVLGQLAGQCGFREVARGRPAKRLNGAHAKSLLRYKAETSALGHVLALAASAVPDGLPIPYPSEDLFWAVYRKV